MWFSIAVDLQKLDLNLLKVLAVLLEERSVVRSAERLCVSPSAVSHALARLRRAFGDPLFVRTWSRMSPTVHAESMRGSIRLLMESLQANFAPAVDADDAFDPLQAKRSLRIASPGALELTLVPALAAKLRVLASGWSLAVDAWERRSYETDIASGRVDFVLAIGGHTPAIDRVGKDLLWEDEMVVLAGPRSRLFNAAAPIAFDDYIAEPQVYPPPWTSMQNYLDVELARAGKYRNLVQYLPSYAGVGPLLQTSDLIASMPDRTAAALVKLFPGLRIVSTNPAKRSPLHLLWSRAGQDNEPALRWARKLITDVAATIPPPMTAPD